MLDQLRVFSWYVPLHRSVRCLLSLRQCCQDWKVPQTVFCRNPQYRKYSSSWNDVGCGILLVLRYCWILARIGCLHGTHVRLCSISRSSSQVPSGFWVILVLSLYLLWLPIYYIILLGTFTFSYMCYVVHSQLLHGICPSSALSLSRANVIPAISLPG